MKIDNKIIIKEDVMQISRKKIIVIAFAIIMILVFLAIWSVNYCGLDVLALKYSDFIKNELSLRYYYDDLSDYERLVYFLVTAVLLSFVIVVPTMAIAFLASKLKPKKGGEVNG